MRDHRLSASAGEPTKANAPPRQNFSIIKEFTHPTGQILSSRFTGLRPVNQRKVAKMIRRAVGMGIYPSVHDHPEMLRERFFPYSGGRI